MVDLGWVGLSARSMVLAPRIGREFCQWEAPSGDDTTLGVVDGVVEVASEGQWRLLHG